MHVRVLIIRCLVAFVFGSTLGASAMEGSTSEIERDAFSWIEVSGKPEVTSWVRRQNERTWAEFENDPRFRRYVQLALAYGSAAESPLKGAAVNLSLHDGWVYKLVSDGQHPRGMWQRVRLSSYVTDEPSWETLLDVGQKDFADHRMWVMTGPPIFSPNGRRCLIRFSDGGSNIYQFREFDLPSARFVVGGFHVPPGRSATVAWRDNDTILVATEFEDEPTQGSSSRPRAVKEWSRGQALSEARQVFRGQPDDFMVSVNQADMSEDAASANGKRLVKIVRRARDLTESWWQLDATGVLKKMTLPDKHSSGTYVMHDESAHYVFVTTADWAVGGQRFKAGSILAIPVSEISDPVPRVSLVLQPSDEESIVGKLVATPSGLLVMGAHLGSSFMWRIQSIAGKWRAERVPLPPHGLMRLAMVDRHGAYVVYESFLEAPTLYHVDAKQNVARAVKSSRPLFESGSFITEQYGARSQDGTRVTYFIIRPRDLKFDGRSPVLVMAYGAYGGSSSPIYSPSIGKLWLEQGGVYVVANIRGGREQGESWHVTRADREHTYNDMEAVIRDLIRRRITSKKRIGIIGYSAGGLVAGVMLNRIPDLVGAAVLRAPKLDNFRADLSDGTLLAQYREFGSPHIAEERAFLERTSPFQNLKKSANFPIPLILTATNDPNVSPAQPRRFAAKMDALRMPFLYYESAGGGHGGALPGIGQARLDALIFSYLARVLIDSDRAVSEQR